MNFQVNTSAAMPIPAVEPPAPPPSPPDAVELLRQILEVQREQLAYTKAAAAAHDNTSRWRAYLARWQNEFPNLADGCKKALPLLERCYGQLISDLTVRLGEDDIDNDFALQELLDRYGMRLAQLGTILNLVAPLAEAAAPNEPA